jgi:hypothetical protein
MATSWFIDRPSPLEGIQWQGDNLDDMNEWASRYGFTFSVDENGSALFVDENDNLRVSMAVGDWWMQNRTYPFTQEVMDIKYQEVSNVPLTFNISGS